MILLLIDNFYKNKIVLTKLIFIFLDKKRVKNCKK